jgi:hypothetical protein
MINAFNNYYFFTTIWNTYSIYGIRYSPYIKKCHPFNFKCQCILTKVIIYPWRFDQTIITTSGTQFAAICIIMSTTILFNIGTLSIIIRGKSLFKLVYVRVILLHMSVSLIEWHVLLYKLLYGIQWYEIRPFSSCITVCVV